MPNNVYPLSESRIIAGLLREHRRGSVAVGQQTYLGAHETFTTSPHTLTYLPSWINVLAVNGVVKSEDVDYTVDYTAGTVTITLAGGDTAFVSYVTTGELAAFSGPVDGGPAATYVSSNSNLPGGGITGLTGIQVDDLVLIRMVSNTAQPCFAASQPGWTYLHTAVLANNVQVDVAYRSIVAADVTAGGVSTTAAGGWAGWGVYSVAAYRNVTAVASSAVGVWTPTSGYAVSTVDLIPAETGTFNAIVSAASMAGITASGAVPTWGLTAEASGADGHGLWVSAQHVSAAGSTTSSYPASGGTVPSGASDGYVRHSCVLVP